MVFLIMIFCCIRIYSRARAMNLNALSWAVRTLVAMIVTWLIGAVIVVTILAIKDPVIKQMMFQPDTKQADILAHMQKLNLFVPDLFMLVCSLGGFLFIYRKLQRLAGKAPEKNTDQ